MLNYTEQKLEVKSLDLQARTFTASATGIGNVDWGLDKFMPGAFKRTIDAKVKAGKVKFVDAHFYKYGDQYQGRGSVPSTKFIMGKVISAMETATDLMVEIYVSATPDGDDLLTKIKDGVVDALSIGFMAIKVSYDKEDDGRIVRLIHEAKLMEVSAVVWGMNDRALIDAASVKNVFGMQDWPLAKDDTPWNAEKAIERLETKTDGNLKDFRRCFLHFEGEDITDIKNYKYPYCDVIEDKIVSVPKALYAATKTMKEDGVDLPKLNKQLERWTVKMEKPELKAITFTGTLAEKIAQDELWRLSNTFNETLSDIAGDEAVEEKTALIEKALDEYKLALANLLLDTKSAKLTDDEDCYIIKANEPLIALLKDSEAHGNDKKPAPPNSEETRYASEDQMAETKIRIQKLRIDQLR